LLTVADPENMLVMLQTWQAGDCSLQEPYNGDFPAAMKGIKAKMLVLPSATDLYFRKWPNRDGYDLQADVIRSTCGFDD